MRDILWTRGNCPEIQSGSLIICIGLSALLFCCGCQSRKSGGSGQSSIEYARTVPQYGPIYADVSPENRFYGGGTIGPMSHLTAAEFCQATGPYPTMTSVAQPQASTSTGLSKWNIVGKDLRELPGVMWEDTKDIVRNPSNWIILGAAGAGSIVGEFTFDDNVDDQLRGRKIINRDWTIAVGASGNPATHFTVAAAIYTHGLLNENPDTYDFGKTLTQALALNGLATVVLKAAAWNHVPNGELWGWPSGHTSSTMTVASVVHEYYGLLTAAPLYALTGLVMYERMITGEHWASDVIFGAALGFVVGHSVAGDQPIQLFGMDVLPYTDRTGGATGIALTKSW